MKRAATISLAMTLITLSSGIFKPATAEGLLTDLVKDTLGTAVGVTGAVVGGATGITAGAVSGAANIVTGTVDATGSVIDASGRVVGRVLDPTVTTTTTTATNVYTFGPAPVVYASSIDTRVADLGNAIAVVETRRNLTSAQAAELRAELDRINTAYVSAHSGAGLTFPGALTVARDLDAFNTRLGTTIAMTPFTPLIVTQNGTERILVSSSVVQPGVGSVVGSTVSGASNIVTSTGDVLDASGRVIGTIVPGSFDATVSTAGSSRVIMGTTTNVLSTSIDLRIADMRRLVAQNQFNGKLTPVQAAELTTSLDRISSTLATERVAGRTLTFEEAVALARDLDAANVRLGQFVGKAPFSPMVVMQQGSPGLMIITKGGVISSADVPTVTTGVPTMTTTVPTVATAVPTVATGLPGVTSSPATMWPNVVPATTVITSTNGIATNVVAVMPIIDARRMEIDRSIANAVANRSLNISEAARLSTDLNRIGMKIAAAQAAGANCTMDQTVVLARSLDDFNVRVATAIGAAPLVPLTVTNSVGVPVLSPTTFSNVIGLPAVEPNLWFTTLTTRRAELEQMIATGAGTSTLTGSQATDLRNELARINALIEGARTAGTISYTTALPIAMNLDVLGSRIHTYVTSVPYTPLISGGRITFAGGLISPIDELSLRRAELGASIDRERALGRLSVGEAQRLQFQLGAIGEREGRFRHDGLFTYRELTIINDDLNRLTGRVNSMIANRRATVSLR